MKEKETCGGCDDCNCHATAEDIKELRESIKECGCVNAESNNAD